MIFYNVVDDNNEKFAITVTKIIMLSKIDVAVTACITFSVDMYVK